MTLDTSFEFIAESVPGLLILGGILLFVLSLGTAPFDTTTTGFARGMGIFLVLSGIFLEILLLFKDRF